MKLKIKNFRKKVNNKFIVIANIIKRNEDDDKYAIRGSIIYW